MQTFESDSLILAVGGSLEHGNFPHIFSAVLRSRHGY